MVHELRAGLFLKRKTLARALKEEIEDVTPIMSDRGVKFLVDLGQSVPVIVPGTRLPENGRGEVRKQASMTFQFHARDVSICFPQTDGFPRWRFWIRDFLLLKPRPSGRRYIFSGP